MGKYFDDFEVGQRFETASRTIVDKDLVEWCSLVQLDEEIFVDREAARRSLFGAPIVPGIMTHAIAMSLFVRTRVFSGTGLAFLGTQIRVLAPVYLNDTIRAEVEVAGKKTTSKPDRGVVTLLGTVINQHGQAVLSYRQTQMIRRRPEMVQSGDSGG